MSGYGVHAQLLRTHAAKQCYSLCPILCPNTHTTLSMEAGCAHALYAPPGKIILEAPDRIAKAPDGNGGVYMALHKSGCLDHMVGTEAVAQGVRWHFARHPGRCTRLAATATWWALLLLLRQIGGSGRSTGIVVS